MKNWMKKQVAVLLTFVLAFSVTVPVAAEGTEEKVQTVTVTLSGQANNEFLFVPGEYTIPSNEAEKYGYEDEAGAVTTLDALVYAHEVAYGDKFTKETKDDYLTVTDGSVTKAFETECDEYSFDFVVNEQRPHTEEEDEWFGYKKCTISQGKLKDKDRVGYFFYQDIFSDASTWFEQGRQKVTSLVLQEDETKDLVLKGYVSYYSMGSSKEETIEGNAGGIPNAPLTLIKIGEKTASPINVTGESGGETTVGLTTDEVGNVTLPNLQAGEYYLSAYVTTEEGVHSNPIIMPLCKLKVVNIEDALTNALKNRKAKLDNAAYGAEWAVLTQARNGNQDDAWYHSYYRSVEQTLKASSNNMIGEYGSDNARTVIALTAMGMDPTNVGGKNLLEPLADLSIAEGGYVTNAAYSLIALDCGKYDIPETSATNKTTREKLVNYILSSFNKDGFMGYTWGDDYFDDPDSVAMAIQALAPYYETNEKVKTKVDKALQLLSEKQNADGTFGSSDPVCTTAQVICALSALGIDAGKDERFVKNGISAVCGMLLYANDDGSIATATAYNPIMSTEQAGYALVAYDRLKNSKNGLYEIAADKVAADAFYKCKDAEITIKGAKEATCTEEGYTGDAYCNQCKAVVEKGNVIPKKAHTPVVDPAVEPTEDKEGKTEGSHCSVCGTVIKAQTVIPKKEKKTEQATTEVKATTEAPTTQHEVVLEKPVGNTIKSTKKKQLKIALKARNDVSGYQIEVSTSSKFKNSKLYNVKNANVGSKTIKGLKSKKTYYVRIRTYNQFVENKQKVTIYSKWSKVKKIKVK